MRIAQVTLGLMAALLLGGVARASSMTGGNHDFTGASWNSTGQLCLPCHVPHHAPHPDDGPIWNHDLSAKTSFTRTPYGGSQTDYTSFLTAGSKTCLGCHDGSTALESFSLNDKATGKTYLDGTYTSTKLSLLSGKAMRPQIGQSTSAQGTLQADHPIGVVYPNTGTTDSSFRAPGDFLFGATSGTTVGALLDATNGTVQCASCHYAHGGQDGYNLRVSNAGSALCRSCHNK